MDELNDVVRHVILRILVDQAGLAESLAAAREKLKALKDSERQINQDRAKNHETLTRAIEAQNQAFDKNRQAEEAYQRSAENRGKTVGEQVKANTAAIDGETKSIKQRTVEESRAAAIDSKTDQDRLDRQRKRSADKKRDATTDQKSALDLAALESKLHQDELDRIAERSQKKKKGSAQELLDTIYTAAIKTKLDSDERQRGADARAQRKRDNAETAAEVEKTLNQANKLNAEANAVRSKAKTGREESKVKVEDTQSRTTLTKARTDEVNERRTRNQKTEKERDEDRKKRDDKDAKREAEKAAVAEENARNAEEKEQTRKSLAAAKDLRRRFDAAQKQKGIDEAQAERDTKAWNTMVDRAYAENTIRDANAEKQKNRDATQAGNSQAAWDKTIFQAYRENDVREANAKKRAKREADQAAAATERDAKRAELAEKRAQKVAERERVRLQRQRQTGPIASAVAAVSNVGTALGTIAFQGAEDTRYRKARTEMVAVGRETSSARQAIGAFFTAFLRGDSSAKLTTTHSEVRKVGQETGEARKGFAALFAGLRSGAREGGSIFSFLTSRVKNFAQELKPAVSGGGNLFNNFMGNLRNVAEGFIGNVGKISKHLISFQSLIILVIAAFGPLMAILGAVGAMALGLASNLGALAGALFALPGLIGAAVAAFGALAIVMKPISNVFSAFSAAQKDSTKATNQAIKATQALADARVQAKRKIEDYQTALKNLKLQEEGAALGVAAAKQAYMQALVDPTSSALDVAQAKLAYQQSIADQQQQKTDATRTRQDAAVAISRGVEGSTEVESAKASAASTSSAQLAKQLDKLPPKTRAVVEAIIGDKNGKGGLVSAWKSLRDTFSENIFGPISAETGKFKDVIGILNSFMGPTTKALGTFVKSAFDLLDSPTWKQFFSDQGTESAYIVQQLGKALLVAANGFRAVVEASRDFTRFVVDGILKMAEAFRSFADSDKGRDKIEAFLKNTQKRMSELWPVIKNFAAGIAGFFAALNTAGGGETDFTSWFNKGLLDASKHFRELGDLARDPNGGFQTWLRNVRPVIHDVVEFLGAAGRAFGKLFSDKNNLNEAHNLLKAISEKWLPKLAEIFDNLSKSGVISKLASAIGSALDALNNFFEHGGVTAVGLFAEGISKGAAVLDWMTHHIPGLIGVIGTLASVLAAVFGAALFIKFSGLYDMIKLVTGGVKVLLGLIKGEKLADLLKLGVNSGSGSGGGSGGSSGSGGTKNKPTTPTPGGGGGGVVATGAEVEIEESELLVLKRIEAYARQIAFNTGNPGSADDTEINETEKNKPATKTKPGDVIEDVEKDVKTGGKKSWWRKLLPFGGNVAEDAAVAAAATAGTTAAASKSGGFFSGIKKFFTGGSSKAATAGTAAEVAGDAGSVASKFLRGGPAAIAAAIAAQIGGSLVIDKFVKNDKDKASLQRGLNNVATGVGVGSMFGPIGGAVGYVGSAGYSLATDKNLRSFVADKGLAGSLGNILFGTKDGTKKPSVATSAVTGLADAAAGPVGLLAGLVSPLFQSSDKKKPGSKDVKAPAAKDDNWLNSLTGGRFPDVSKTVTDGLAKAGSVVRNFFTKTIPGLVSTAAGAIGGFFTKTIPAAFHAAVSGITAFFTKTLPGLPKKAVGAIIFDFGRLWVVFTEQLPRIIGNFFTKTIPNAASKSWNFIKHDLWDPFAKFVTKTAPAAIGHFFTRTVPEKASEAWTGVKRDLWEPFLTFVKGIPGFFTKTIPHWFSSAWHWFTASVFDPVKNFITTTVPKFFTDTIPKWFAAAPGWFKTHVIDPVTSFFTVTVPNFFTQTLPEAIKAIPGWMYSNLVKPVTDFFGGLSSHIHIMDLFSGAKDLWNWAKGLFESGEQAQRGEAKMSGGLIAGIYQGIEDKAQVMATPGEFMFRKRVVDEPGAKAIMHDWNEGRIDVSSLYKGLSATAAPPTMSIVPPTAQSMTGAIPTVVNHTVNHAPVFGGDVTINNPHREKAEWSLRRRLEVAANRHRR